MMKKGTTEDTSVNLFRNSANLGDEERVAFAKKLWNKSATKPNLKFTPETAKAGGREDRKGTSVAQRIEFDAPSGKAQHVRKDGTRTAPGLA
jgi:hypothetical protein